MTGARWSATPTPTRGVSPGEAALVDRGLNARFANALVEGGPENGVLTAIEDFVASRGHISLHVLPFHNGLGILVPDSRRTPEVDALIARFFGPEMLMARCRALEEDGMEGPHRRCGVRAAAHSAYRRLSARTSDARAACRPYHGAGAPAGHAQPLPERGAACVRRRSET